MASKHFEEKQVEKQLAEKDLPKEKESIKVEKHEKTEKHEKNEKAEKEHKDQKDQKDNPDTKTQKDGKDQKDNPDSKHKHEKEKHEKEQIKDKEHKPEYKEQALEKTHAALEVLPQAQAPMMAPGAVTAHKYLEKTHKDKIEIKETKQEIKEHKFEKYEKVEFKDFKVEKVEFDGYQQVPGPVPPGGPVEQRLAALEAAVTQLLHFIPENLRPDLSQGALKQEPDAAKTTPKTEPPPPKKS